LYKPERAPARTKGTIKAGNQAPIALQDANTNEISLALFALAREAGVTVGRGGSYDALKDLYTVVGKSVATGKAQDFTVQGQEVADVIMIARMFNGGVLERVAG
jgi:hypothetical protein